MYKSINVEGFIMDDYPFKNVDDKLLFFFLILSLIWDAKYSRDSLLFFFLILLLF